MILLALAAAAQVAQEIKFRKVENVAGVAYFDPCPDWEYCPIMWGIMPEWRGVRSKAWKQRQAEAREYWTPPIIKPERDTSRAKKPELIICYGDYAAKYRIDCKTGKPNP